MQYLSSTFNHTKYLLGAGLCSALVMTIALPKAFGLSNPSQETLIKSAESMSTLIALSASNQVEILSEHNRYRSAVKVPPLKWSNDLASDARTWANHLSSLGGRRLVHSSYSSRNGQGENLWMGTAGYYSPSRMVQTWGREKEYFKPGVFPNVSKTGNWSSVGHYSQIVWKNTTEVGCATVTKGGNDILVCRYNPTGNIVGQKVY